VCSINLVCVVQLTDYARVAMCVCVCVKEQHMLSNQVSCIVFTYSEYNMLATKYMEGSPHRSSKGTVFCRTDGVTSLQTNCEAVAVIFAAMILPILLTSKRGDGGVSQGPWRWEHWHNRWRGSGDWV
jgi:hypothetical protein